MQRDAQGGAVDNVNTRVNRRLKMKACGKSTIIVSFLIVLVFAGSGLAEWMERQKLVPPGGEWFDAYGVGVHISGDYLIVGSPGDIFLGFETGAAYIYKRGLWDWYYKQMLLASDKGVYDSFGISVGMDGEYAIIGAFGDDDLGAASGSAYIFGLEDTQWIQQTKLRASDGAAGDEFGKTVSISGDFAIVGCPFHDDGVSDSGAAYVYKREDTGWVEQAKLTASDRAAGDWFGWSVSLSGRYAIVGSRMDDDHGSGSGSAYIFEYREGQWVELQKLTASDGVRNANFGFSVFMRGDEVIVGAAYENDRVGSAYIFERGGTNWVEQAKLTASDGARSDYFGYSVSICDDFTIVGAEGDDDRGDFSGSAYIFKRDVSGWSLHTKLTASDGTESDAFGDSVSIDGKYMAVGAIGDNWDMGATYIFINKEPMTFYVDANASGSNDGSRWADAFNDLQDGLDATWKNDEIWVAQGTYTPGSRTTSFSMKNEVAIKGGYAGLGAHDPNARDIEEYKTILSGDLNHDDGPNFINYAENSYHVVTAMTGITSTAVLDGCIITAGNADGSYPNSRGGGIYIDEGCSPTIKNCTFSKCKANRAGGMYVGEDSNSIIINCKFYGNSANTRGGGLWNNLGSPSVKNCIFIKNISNGDGGAIYDYTHGQTTITNCLFISNSATFRSGGIESSYGTLTMANSILWNNSDSRGVNELSQISSNYEGYEGQPGIINYCCIQGWTGTYGGIGNIGDYPVFVDHDNENYHLLPDSPCINAGDPNYVAESNETDFDGKPRVIGGRIDIGPYEFNHIPVADAGPDQTVYAWFDGMAQVVLDGSGSFDDDSHLLSYLWSWTVDDNSFAATGPTPIIQLPAGEHIIELIVNDGIEDSEPDEVIITVIPPIEATLKLTPKVLNADSQGNWIKAHFVMPEDCSVSDVDVNTPATMEPFGIESEYINAFINEDGLVEIEIAFNHAAVCGSGLDYGPHGIAIVGMLTNGQYFYGTDTIRVTANDIKHIAGFVSHWLESGCSAPDWCNGTDVDRSSTVDFADFTMFDRCCIEVIGE
jgi:parallel beta-helix repeat protein